MKKSEYPPSIPRAAEYTAGDVAILYGVAHRTACSMIDRGILKGHRVPGGIERRVRHEDLMRHARGNHGNFAYVLAKIDGLSEEERAIFPPDRQP